MDRKHLTRAGLSLCVCLAAMALVGNAEAAKKEVLTITGKIQGAEMRNGKIVTTFIADAELGEFIVLRGTDVAKRLLKNVGETIRATGYVGNAVREKEFDRYIDILEFEFVPESESAAGGS